MQSDPLFKRVLADQWDELGEIIQKHYSLRPGSDDYICVVGEMQEVHHSFLAKAFLPLGMLFGAIVPFRGKNVPVEVHCRTKPDDAKLYSDRDFRFPGKKPFHFESRMEHVAENEVIEFVKFGLGLRLVVTVEDGALIFRSKGYVLQFGGETIDLPEFLLLGKAYIEERPIDDESFSMKYTLTHPLWGQLFRYNGRFTLGCGR